VHQKRRKEEVEMKNNGIWWAVGAVAAGLGAWLMFGKKAEAQEPAPIIDVITPISPDVIDKGNTPDEEWKQFIFDSPVMTPTAVDQIRTWMADPVNAAAWKAATNKLAQACLPWGNFVTADFAPASGGNAVLRMVFSYVGDIDPGAVKACMLRGGV
jgi:hypothetical protein